MYRFSSILFLFLFNTLYLNAQVNVYSSTDHWEIDTLVPAPNPQPWQMDRGEVENKLRRNKHKFNPIPTKNSSVIQTEFGSSFNDEPALKWDGMDYQSQLVAPPDPSIGVGKNYVVQMVNTAMQVWDKAGNSQLGPTALSNVFPGSADDGDPIVLYDKFAERWFISQFQVSGNQILIAISQGDNPLSGWDFYSYSLAEFPDYPKYSIWSDGYYMTANSSDENMVVFERDSMLAGASSARMITMTIPNIATNGFFSALPLNCATDDISDCTGSNFVFYFEDDGWTGQDDIVKNWKVDVDWTNPSNSAIQLNESIVVADFDSEFTTSWDDIEQPNTDARLDAVPGAFMFMANYNKIQGTNSLVLTHTIDVDPSSEMVGGLRWYDFERSGDSWSLTQQGTFAPDDGNSRFMPSIAKDQSGNIAVAYSISGPDQYPSLAYTGRYNGDESGKFTLQEKIAFEGFGVQEGTNRYGDYAHMTVDPNDGSLFWFTGEYMDVNGWKTGVFSYRLPIREPKNLMADRILRPRTGDLSDTNVVHIQVRNTGTDSISNFWTILEAAGIKDSVFTSVKIGPNQTYQVSGFASRDLRNAGDYLFMAWVNAADDNQPLDDTVRATVTSLPPADVVMDRVIAPVSGFDLGQENLVIELYNNGSDTLYDVPVTYNIDGNVSNDVVDVIYPGVSRSFTFTSTYDFSTFATYSVEVYSAYDGDFDISNDTIQTSIQKLACSPESDCNFGDEILTLTINDDSNSSECTDGGYEDLSGTPLFALLEGDNTISIQTGSDWQSASIWIDWNQNLYFDDEEIWVEDIFFDFDTTFSVQLPESAEAGMYLMRIRIAYGESTSNPCNDVFFGETEDYTVSYNVTSSSFKELANSFYYSQSTNTLIFEQSEGRFEVFDIMGRRIQSEVVASQNYSLDHFSAGTYVVRYKIGGQSFSKKVVVK